MWVTCKPLDPWLPSQLDVRIQVSAPYDVVKFEMSLVTWSACLLTELFRLGIGEIEIPKTGTVTYAFEYLFDIFIHVTLALSVFATSQSALVLIYGPTKVTCSVYCINRITLLAKRNMLMFYLFMNVFASRSGCLLVCFLFI